MANIAPNQAAIGMLTQGMSREELNELLQLIDYMGERADPSRNPGGNLPEGSIASLLNRASPKVRTAIGRVSDLIETPRGRPFDPKLSEGEHLHLLGLDPDIGVTIKAALDTQDVAAGVQSRMGTDKDLPDTPPSMADVLSAAYDKHSKRGDQA